MTNYYSKDNSGFHLIQMKESTKIAEGRFYINNIYYIPLNTTLFPSRGVDL
jgi:hypothetical protein